MVDSAVPPRSMLLYGSPDPLPAQTALRAGPLRLVFEQGDLRGVCLGEEEILSRVYAAVRDQNWVTIPPRISSLNVQAGVDAFRITYEAEHRGGAVDFAWHAEIRGTADGSITFSMDGTARASFWKNRIGFCALLPAGLAGRSVEIEHSTGAREPGFFPDDLCAAQPVPSFSDLRALRTACGEGGTLELRFSGDLFEMEDQRLWTDASFKIYGTPLSQPYPVEIQAGTRITQSVQLRLLPGEQPAQSALLARSAARTAALSAAPGPIRLEMRGGWQPLPALGLSTASHGAPLGPEEVQRLRVLRLDHLRAEIDLSTKDFVERLQQAADQSAALEVPLLLALPLDPASATDALGDLRRVLEGLRLKIRGWLVFPAAEPYAGGRPSAVIARAAWQQLKAYDPALPLAVGTNTDFIFLKRTRLPLEHMDQVCITLNPQVHAFDTRSLVETLAAQPLLVHSARRMAKGRPVLVSPITLKPRFNPYAAGPPPEVPMQVVTLPEQVVTLPQQVDTRQMALFGAGWTLGSLRAMVAAGAARVTYYETTGWRGVLERSEGSPLPAQFPSIPGAVFPLYHLLRWAADFAGGEGLVLSSSQPPLVSGLALRRGSRTAVLLANHTQETVRIRLPGGMGIPDDLSATWLDESTALLAMRSPEAFQEQRERVRPNSKGELVLEIKPFGLVQLL